MNDEQGLKVFRQIKKSSYSITMQCHSCNITFSVPVEVPEPDYIKAIEYENAVFREALKRIDNECSRDDTVAWKIACDALENV